MKKNIALLVGFLATYQLVSSSTAFAGEVEVTGFADVLYQARQGKNSSLGMGAFEIDFASEFSDKICFEGAIVVEGDEVGLGQTLVDFKLLEDKLGLQAGLLDMPFGIDYQVFATPDRKLVSLPLVTELMMDEGWGDVGINLHGSISKFNFNLYAVNGMGQKYEVEDDTTSALVPANQLSDNNNGKTIGARVGACPAKDLEIGFSYVQGPYLDDNTKDNIYRSGVDIQFAFDVIKLKAEYVTGKEKIPAAKANKHAGYYAQLLGNVTDELYGAARYGWWKLEGGDEATRSTIGLGYDLPENISVRFEYQINGETQKQDNNMASAQVVISF